AGLGADPAPQLLAALAGNPLADTKALTPLLQKSAEKTAGGDPQTVADLLLALGDLAARAGNWPLQIAGRDRTGHGVVVAKPPEKTAGFALRNTGGRPLYVLPAAIAAPPPLPATLRRRLFRPDGGEIMDGRLARGAPTIMEIEGPWPQTGGKPAAEIAIHDALPLGLRVAGCALDPGTAVAPGWAWLGKLGLDRAASCAAESHGLNAVIAAPANAASASWHLAYPVEAVEPGRYLSGPVTLRALGAGNGPVTQIAQPAAMRAVEIR
ncbi:MAG TPA: hypothetical protein VMV79_07635, partial [Alphaproteobacteria bacterium]|nr:hypothetical protein [Alphaproteobacteria bacterium]